MSESRADQLAAALRLLGYTGSIQDMQLRYLEDENAVSEGTGSRSLLQLTTDGQVQDLIEVP